MGRAVAVVSCRDALRCASRLKVPLLPFNPKSKIRNPKSEI